MKKLLFIAFFSISLSADYLLQTTNVCIKSYYFQNGYLYYTLSDTGATVTVSTKNLGDDIFDGYEYNATTHRCLKADNTTLGMTKEDFNYLNGFVGLSIAFIMLGGLFL